MAGVSKASIYLIPVVVKESGKSLKTAYPYRHTLDTQRYATHNKGKHFSLWRQGMAIGTGETGTRTATGEVRTSPGAIHKHMNGGRSRIGTRILALLTRVRHSETTPIRSRRHNSVGVMPADWEYITNIAPRQHPESWDRLIWGGMGGSRKH